MNTRRMSLLLLFLTVGFLSRSTGFAQCSDAGACTISRHAGMGEEEGMRQTVGLKYAFGLSGSPDDVTYHSIIAEANLHVLERSRVILSLPFNIQSGPLGNSSGIGDVIAIWDQTAFEWDGGMGRVGVQGGARIGTGEANAEPGLPMAYQPGLGSTDLILGASVLYSGWSAGGAYQFAGARNDNELVRLKRGDQLVVWGSYEFTWGTTRLSPGVTMINQFQESSILDPASSSGAIVSVPGSDQFQINLGLRVRQEVSSRFGVELLGVLPLLARDVNVDGLKRALTLSVNLFAIL